MKQKEVFKKIGGIIQELNDQYEYLKTVPDDLNDLELELFVSNAHFLTDHIEILRKLNLQNLKTKKPPVEKTETPREQKYFEPVVQQMKHVAGDDEKPLRASNNTVEITFTTGDDKEDQPITYINLEPGTRLTPTADIHEEPATIRHELILDDTEDWDDDENLPEDDIAYEDERLRESQKRKIVIPPPAARADDVVEPKEVKVPDNAKPRTEEEEVLTINQKISSQLGDKALGRTDELAIKPITDIKLAITLNDKLLYVKDLFNGYNLAYSEAIEILNRFNTFEEAQRFLKTNYVAKNNWDSKPETTGKFYALLKRRYT